MLALNQQFYQHVLKNRFWKNQEKLLVAVSGGVDSMVLLDLLGQLPKNKRPLIGVIHFNHQLREESFTEQKELKELCIQKSLPFFTEKWSEGPNVVSNIEAEARKARYAYFFRMMEKEGYDALLTAHHGNDQAETIIQKLIRGSLLNNYVGIQPVSFRKGYKIIRPLLNFTKKQLEIYANDKQLSYWEDLSNQSTAFQRNRIRAQLLPFFEKENPGYLKQMNHFSEQVSYQNEIVKEYITPKYKQMLSYKEGMPTLAIDFLLAESVAVRYQILVEFLQEHIIENEEVLHSSQVSSLLNLLESTSSKEIQLANGQRVYKVGSTLFLVNQADFQEVTLQRLELNEPIEVGNQMWLVLKKGIKKELDKEVIDEIIITEEDLPLTIRAIEEGDRFVFNAQGKKKRVSRYFIDEKIPFFKRQGIPLIVNNRQNILWILNYRKSYLSIHDETDKILYKLFYYKKGE